MCLAIKEHAIRNPWNCIASTVTEPSRRVRRSGASSRNAGHGSLSKYAARIAADDGYETGILRRPAAIADDQSFSNAATGFRGASLAPIPAALPCVRSWLTRSGLPVSVLSVANAVNRSRPNVPMLCSVLRHVGSAPIGIEPPFRFDPGLPFSKVRPQGSAVCRSDRAWFPSHRDAVRRCEGVSYVPTLATKRPFPASP